MLSDPVRTDPVRWNWLDALADTGWAVAYDVVPCEQSYSVAHQFLRQLVSCIDSVAAANGSDIPIGAVELYD